MMEFASLFSSVPCRSAKPTASGDSRRRSVVERAVCLLVVGLVWGATGVHAETAEVVLDAERPPRAQTVSHASGVSESSLRAPALGGELSLGIGTPLGLAGASMVAFPVRWLSLRAGAGITLGGIQYALMAGPRLQLSDTICVGGALGVSYGDTDTLRLGDAPLRFGAGDRFVQGEGWTWANMELTSDVILAAVADAGALLYLRGALGLGVRVAGSCHATEAADDTGGTLPCTGDERWAPYAGVAFGMLLPLSWQ